MRYAPARRKIESEGGQLKQEPENSPRLESYGERGEEWQTGGRS